MGFFCEPFLKRIGRANSTLGQPYPSCHHKSCLCRKHLHHINSGEDSSLFCPHAATTPLIAVKLVVCLLQGSETWLHRSACPSQEGCECLCRSSPNLNLYLELRPPATGLRKPKSPKVPGRVLGRVPGLLGGLLGAVLGEILFFSWHSSQHSPCHFWGFGLPQSCCRRLRFQIYIASLQPIFFLMFSPPWGNVEDTWSQLWLGIRLPTERPVPNKRSQHEGSEEQWLTCCRGREARFTTPKRSINLYKHVPKEK